MFKITTRLVGKPDCDRQIDTPANCKVYDLEARTMVSWADGATKVYDGNSRRGIVTFYPKGDRHGVGRISKAVKAVLDHLIAEDADSPIVAEVEILDLMELDQFAVFAVYERISRMDSLSLAYWYDRLPRHDWMR